MQLQHSKNSSDIHIDFASCCAYMFFLIDSSKLIYIRPSICIACLKSIYAIVKVNFDLIPPNYMRGWKARYMATTSFNTYSVVCGSHKDDNIVRYYVIISQALQTHTTICLQSCLLFMQRNWYIYVYILYICVAQYTCWMWVWYSRVSHAIWLCVCIHVIYKEMSINSRMCQVQ